MKKNEREAQIQRALKALESGKYTTLGEAAIAFKVPKSTLGHRRTGRQTRCKAHEKEQLQSLCKSLGENQNHTKKYNFRDFRAVVRQPPQHSYNREFSS